MVQDQVDTTKWSETKLADASMNYAHMPSSASKVDYTYINISTANDGDISLNQLSNYVGPHIVNSNTVVSFSLADSNNTYSADVVITQSALNTVAEITFASAIASNVIAVQVLYVGWTTHYITNVTPMPKDELIYKDGQGNTQTISLEDISNLITYAKGQGWIQ